MSTPVFQYKSQVVPDSEIIGTGHVAAVMAWEDGPNGRRPGNTPERDEVTDAPVQMVDVLMPIGRDGAPTVVSVRIAAFEVPDLAAYAPVEFDGLRVQVRASRQGKGVDVSFSADAVRPANAHRPGRRAAEQTEAA